MNITLIGYRGSGKSTIGKRLAQLLAMDFVDTDLLITATAGKTIKQIFEAEGEAGFRDRESVAIREAAARINTVIAAGGGAILRPENVAALRATSKIIWLQADPETLHARIHADPATAANRPSLTSLSGGIEEIRTILEKRTPLYATAAHHTLDIARISPDEAAQALQRLLS
jgi:shikimate kinase